MNFLIYLRIFYALKKGGFNRESVLLSCFKDRTCNFGYDGNLPHEEDCRCYANDDELHIHHEEDCRKFKFLFEMFYESDISIVKNRAIDDAKDVEDCNRLARNADDRVRSERKIFRHDM